MIEFTLVCLLILGIALLENRRKRKQWWQGLRPDQIAYGVEISRANREKDHDEINK